SLADARYPSSVGITFAGGIDAPRLVSSVSAARYEPEEGKGTAWAGDLLESAVVESTANRVWRRIPIRPQPFHVDPQVVGVHRSFLDEEGGLELYCRVRPPSSGEIPITVALVNRREAKPGQRDAASYFQPEIE